MYKVLKSHEESLKVIKSLNKSWKVIKRRPNPVKIDKIYEVSK